jgi:ATP-dependent Clp protease ATP-binding subunit ClpA
MAIPKQAKDIFFADGNLRLDLLDKPATDVLHESMRLARETHWDRLRSPHVFMGLLAVPDDHVRHWGKRLGTDLTKLLEQFQELFQQADIEDAAVVLNREFLSDNVIRLLRDAHRRALDNHRQRITSMDLLISILTSPQSFVAQCFEHVGITAARLTEWAVMAEFNGHS